MTATAYFAANYIEAREKFLSACAARSLPVTSLLNPNAKGAAGEDLYTDVVRIGREDASKVLVLTSATHGVEGYCGSGAQVGLLREGFFCDLPEDLSVVIVHAMNPYGFSHNRRVNEDNVDLNRNFADFANLHDPNKDYALVHPFILPESWDGPAKEAADQGILNFIEEHGLMAFQAAASIGQYRFSDGVFYGGKGPTWSNANFRSVLQDYAGHADQVGIVDFHTGLGPYGYGELISIGTAEQKARAKAWYGDQVTDPEAGTSTSAPVVNTVAHGAYDTLPEQTVTFITVEYGTFDINRILGAVRSDNWLYQKGDINSALGQAIKQDIREAFYPDKDDWKAMVWDRAVEVVGLAQRGLERAGG